MLSFPKDILRLRLGVSVVKKKTNSLQIMVFKLAEIVNWSKDKVKSKNPVIPGLISRFRRVIVSGEAGAGADFDKKPLWIELY